MAWGRKNTAAQKPAWSQDDYHAAFAGKLKEQIEQGVAPWQKPWKPGERRLPENVASKKPYRGGNSVYLSVTQTAKSYSDNRRWCADSARWASSGRHVDHRDRRRVMISM